MINWSNYTLSGLYVHKQQKKHLTWSQVLVLCALQFLDCSLFLGFSISCYILIGWKYFEPPHTPFNCSDTSVRNDLFPNTVATIPLLIITLFLPSFSLVIGLFMAHKKIDIPTVVAITTFAVYTFLDYAMCYWMMTLILEIIKCTVGRLRPNFIAMCIPNKMASCDEDKSMMISNYSCLNDYKYGRNSRASFPSGHSGAAVFALVFILIMFNHKLFVSRLSSNVYLGVYRVVVMFLFFIFSVVCCVSRITDYWHWPTDVVGGALIGGLVSYLSFVIVRKPKATI